MDKKQVLWGTRIGFILAAMGMAIGTGNIWRFPRMVAENGGGSFLIGWAIFLFLWSLPLIMVEIVIGRKTRSGTGGSFRQFIGEKFTWMGPLITLVVLGLTCYYSVVVGWTFKYFGLAIQGAFQQGVDSNSLWEAFSTNSVQTIFFHFLAIGLAGVVVYIGINRGIEKLSKIVLPLLFLLLIFTCIRALTLDGAWEGVAFMFTPDWNYLGRAETWMQALSQSAWSVGAGWGLYATYAIYTRQREDIAQNALTAGLGNNSIELLAGLTIIPAIFALAPSADYITQATSAGNTGLIFVYLVDLMISMPGTYIFAIAFFGSLAFAAITTLVALVELVTRNFSDLGLKRGRAIVITVVVCFVFGIPSAMSMTFFNNQDWVWGVLLLLSCLFYSIAAIRYGVEKMRNEINEVSDIKVNRWWVFSIKYCIPTLFVIVIGWWLYQAITWYPETWWLPFEEFNVGTIVFQLAIVLVIIFLANNWIKRKLRLSVLEEGLEEKVEIDQSNNKAKEGM
jgi:NSS family neurotransmitter:Na+ symporter